MASENVLNCISYFCVGEFTPIISDCHCLLQWEVSANYTISTGDFSAKSALKPNFIWSDNSAEMFCSALSSYDIQKRLLQFDELAIYNSQSSIDNMSAELSDTITSAANKSLKRKKIILKSKKTINKKWFDCDVAKIRSQLTSYANFFSSFPKDPSVRGVSLL